MKIELTEQQFRYLLDLVYIGNWVINSTRENDRIQEYDQVESLVFSHCLHHKMGKLVELYRGELIPSKAFADGGIHDAIEHYEDVVFYEILAEELALRDAKIMALQSQINPHFLNNTLEIINWEARLADDVKVCQMLEALSTMLNAAMDRKHRPLIHLSEEMMYVDAYLFIIRERLGKRLTVEKKISPETLDCYVPRLVLQPLLENAVEHGINPVQKGTIIIRAYREQDRLLLEIENDGVTTYDDLMKIQTLLSDEPLPEGTGSASLGIRNVHERVKIIYGQESGLSITITEKGNTLSRMNIKFEQDGQ